MPQSTRGEGPAEQYRLLEEALRASESRFRSLIEKSFDAILLLAADGTVSYASPSTVRVLGFTPDEIGSRDGFDLVHPDDRRRTAEVFAQLIHSPGTSVTNSHRIVRKDGTSRWVDVRATNLLTDPAVKSVVINYQDVTERHQAEESLRREREFLKAVLDNIDDLVVACDAQGNLTFANRAARQTAGLRGDMVPPAEWTRQFTLLATNGKTPLAEPDRPLFRVLRGERVHNFELTFRAADGTLRTFLASGQPLHDAGGNRLGAVVIFNDITEWRLLEQQFIQAQKMEAVGRLAGGIAHDFNNLLTVINGYGSLLLAGLPESDPNREPVAEMTRAGERAAALTRQLLAFGRRQVVSPRVLDLNGVVRDMEKLLRRTIGEDVQMVTRLAPALGSVKADPVQLEQVILNLAVNARDAMPHGGRLTLETANAEPGGAEHELAVGPHVLLSVSDTGSGMTDEVKARIFEPFFTTKEPGQGTGLGLATVYAIVRQSGGRIEVDSEVGRGTTFRVFLPRAAETVKAGVSLPGLGAAPRGNETVLVVEDEVAVRSLTRLILQGLGYTVLEAGGGSEALRVAELHRGPIHLLLTDVVMADMAGRRLAENLQALHPEMKVLYASGYADDAVLRYGVMAAEAHFLQKPFLPVVLAQKVRDVLDAPRPPPSDGG